MRRWCRWLRRRRWDMQAGHECPTSVTSLPVSPPTHFISPSHLQKSDIIFTVSIGKGTGDIRKREVQRWWIFLEKKNTVGHVPTLETLFATFNILLYPLICICYVMYYYLIHCIEAKVQFYHFSDARNQTMSPLPWFSTDSEFIHETMPLLKVEWYYSLLWIYKKMLCLVTLPTRAEEAVVPFIYSFKEENWFRCLKL